MDLVTGGTGIVGIHVINELLVQGRDVRALFRASSDLDIVRRVLRYYHPDGAERFARIQWVKGDLLDEDALVDAMHATQRVFHCAAIVSFDPRDTEALFKHNITGTANVVNAMIAAGVSRLCHVSTNGTIGLFADGRASTETDEFVRDRNSSPYAISKHEAELEVQRGIAEGLHAVMVNPCVVVGPGRHGRSTMTMIDRVRGGTRFYPPGTNAVVDARDVAVAMVRLLEVGASGERHLLIGENLSYRKLFSLIADAAGKAQPSFELKPWMLEIGWRMERLRTLFGGRPLITRYTARTAYRQRLYNGSKATAMLNTTPRDAAEMIANTIGFINAQ